MRKRLHVCETSEIHERVVQTAPARGYHEQETAMTDGNGRDDDDLLLRLEGGTRRP